MDASQDLRKRIRVSVTSSPRPGTTPGASSLNIERLNWYILRITPCASGRAALGKPLRPRNAYC